LPEEELPSHRQHERKRTSLKGASLVQGPVGKTLIKLTIPMVVGVLGMVLFNLADAFFVGQLGTTELAALSFTFPVVLVIASLALGLGTGASAVISLAIGEGDRHKMQRLTTDSLLLALLIVACFVVIGLLTIDPLFHLLGATPEILPLIKQYMNIWYFGMIFVVIPMVGNNAIRATGDTKTPATIMLVAVAMNFVVDPLLIFGLGPFPRLELRGAAISTVCARATTMLVALYVLAHREKMLTFQKPSLREVINSWKKVLYIGLPTAGTRMIVPLTTGVITGILAKYGPAAVAGYGVSTRIEFFSLSVLRALSVVLAPFVGQNLGANKLHRVIAGIRYSKRFSLVWGAAMYILLAAAARPIASIFSDNPQVISIIVLYLRIVPLGYGLQGVLVLCAASMNVLNKPMQAAALAIVQMFVFYVPLAYAGSHLYGPPGVFGALALAYLGAGIAAHFVLNRYLVERKRAAIAVQPDSG
jgi:putative MATE family efflux protein